MSNSKLHSNPWTVVVLCTVVTGYSPVSARTLPECTASTDPW
jgi:hypothetical protein